MKKNTQAPFAFAEEDRTITVYGYMADTGEYIGKSDCFIPASTGLPALCTHKAPPAASEGQAVIFDEHDDDWRVVEDHRGQTAYNTETRQPETILTPGALPASLTLQVPGGDFDHWDGSTWVEDVAAKQEYQRQQRAALKRRLLADATQRIDVLTDRINLKMAADPDATRTLLDAWRTYRVQLDGADLLSDNWPAPPEGAQ